MNCPSRVEVFGDEGWNQNPSSLSADTTTRADLNGIINARGRRDEKMIDPDTSTNVVEKWPIDASLPSSYPLLMLPGTLQRALQARLRKYHKFCGSLGGLLDQVNSPRQALQQEHQANMSCQCPGFMIAVAYIDPGNYSTDAAAGAATRFKLLFIILMSNLFAVFLQSLCIKLGSVTGLNLAEHCREHLLRWLNYFLYFLAESAIIATDIAEVKFYAFCILL
jgi:metal iron transporter